MPTDPLKHLSSVCFFDESKTDERRGPRTTLVFLGCTRKQTKFEVTFTIVLLVLHNL